MLVRILGMYKSLILFLFIVFELYVSVISYNQPEAVQIIQTTDGPVRDTKVLYYNGGSILKNILTANDVKDLPILVYSVTGKTRGGKSFLLDLMYKYLHHEGKPTWKDGLIPHVFDFKDGADSTTKGLWLCTRIFKRTLQDGTKVGIMLMDNQGLFDGLVTSGESVAMSGVSTILSHVQMFNMKEKVTTNDLEQIMLHLVPDSVEDKNNKQSIIGSSLTFVVRDFMGGKKYGFGLTNGRKYIEEEQKRGTQEYQSMWAEQRSVFNNIDCVLLPHPGLAVMTEEFTEAPNLMDLEDNFVSEIENFFKELFAPKNLVPHSGGFTGQKMHETLTKLDGKMADKSMSYYIMFMDRTNRLILDNAVTNFTNKLETSRDIYKAKELMDMTLTTTKFKGQSVAEFTSNLRLNLERIINSKAKNHIIDTYKAATKGDDIITSHGGIWSKVNSDMRLLIMGSDQVVKPIKDDIVKEIATIYYSKLALQEGAKFKIYCENAVSGIFYEKILPLNNPEGLNTFLESTIKTCEDFSKTGANVGMLNDIRHKQQLQFGDNVKNNILRNMYKVKEYFVQRYSGQLTRQNVRAENSVLWPKYKQEIANLKFGSESEKLEHTQAITREIAAIYYKLFREEVNSNMRSEWSALSDKAFYDKYQTYKDEAKLKTLINEKLPEFPEFHNFGLTHIWDSEKEILVTYVQLMIYEGLKSRNYEKESQSFWVKYRYKIIGGALSLLGKWFG